MRWGLIIVPVQPAAGLTRAALEEITGQSLCKILPRYQIGVRTRLLPGQLNRHDRGD
jgi:hypothetical protein